MVAIRDVMIVAARWEVFVLRPPKALVYVSKIGTAASLILAAPQAHSVEVDTALQALAAVALNVALLQPSAELIRLLPLQNNPLDPLLQESEFLPKNPP